LDEYVESRRLEIVDLENLKLREMANLLSYALPFTVDQKFELLEKPTLAARINLLVSLMKIKFKFFDITDKFQDDTERIN
jgi:Lon protease-like protein